MSRFLFSGRTGFNVGRVTTVPQTVIGLIHAIRDNAEKWLADVAAHTDVKRDDGGDVATFSRNINRYASDLVLDHGADENAVLEMLQSRSFLPADSDNAVIAAILPDRYALGDDGELVSINDDANAAANAATDDANGDDAPDPADTPNGDDAPATGATDAPNA